MSRTRVYIVGLLALWLTASAPLRAQTPASDHQESPRPAIRDDEPRKKRPHRAEHRRRRGPEKARRGAPGLFASRLFRPRPQDLGPAEQAEIDDLLAFAEEHLPMMHTAAKRVLGSADERHAGRQQRTIQRLRHLKRIFDRDPALFRLHRQHAEQMFRLRVVQRRAERLRRDGATADDTDLVRLKREARDIVADMLALEGQTLAHRINWIESDRSALIDGRLHAFLSEQGPPPGERPAIRDRVRRYHEASDTAERRQIAAQLRSIIEREVTLELENLGRRLEHLGGDSSQIIDDWVERLFDDRPKRRRRRPQPPGERERRRPGQPEQRQPTDGPPPTPFPGA